MGLAQTERDISVETGYNLHYWLVVMGIFDSQCLELQGGVCDGLGIR